MQDMTDDLKNSQQHLLEVILLVAMAKPTENVDSTISSTHVSGGHYRAGKCHSSLQTYYLCFLGFLNKNHHIVPHNHHLHHIRDISSIHI